MRGRLGALCLTMPVSKMEKIACSEPQEERKSHPQASATKHHVLRIECHAQ